MPGTKHVRDAVIFADVATARVCADVGLARERQDRAAGGPVDLPAPLWVEALLDRVRELAGPAGRLRPTDGLVSEAAQLRYAGDLRVGLVHLAVAAVAAAEWLDRAFPHAMTAVGAVPAGVSESDDDED